MGGKTDHGEPKPKSKVETREEDFPKEEQEPVADIDTTQGGKDSE